MMAVYKFLYNSDNMSPQESEASLRRESTNRKQRSLDSVEIPDAWLGNIFQQEPLAM